ncbi:MAG: zinc metallopeptidase [Candidatus Eisenbacteria bacterium]|nr:zinc metallopeptidase [Candidatus Eisenbacteria bacterium]
MPFGFFDPTMLLILPGLAFAMWAQYKVRSTYEKWSRVPSSRGETGEAIARSILSRNALPNVTVGPVPGTLSDHYDPRAKTVNLSEGIYHSKSVAALSVAAHECGHAMQDKEGYSPLQFRSAIVPVAGFSSMAAFPLFFVGFLFGQGSLAFLMDLGIILFGAALAFHVITLPVEFNASSRAMAQLENGGYLSAGEIEGAREVLNAAALTYVAATAMAALQLIRMVLLRNSRN